MKKQVKANSSPLTHTYPTNISQIFPWQCQGIPIVLKYVSSEVTYY